MEKKISSSKLEYMLIIIKLLIIVILLNNNFLFNLELYNNNHYNEKILNASNHLNPRFIITFTSIYHNFGDNAITVSTKQFLNYYFPNIQQILITQKQILNIDLIKKFINKEDIIIISGGGNFGLYHSLVKEYVNVINNFPNNHIIFFPCSIFFSEKIRLKYSKYLHSFNQHKSITFFIRDQASYNISKKIFNQSNIYLVPDIVTRLNLHFLDNLPSERNGILLILRNDIELLLNKKNHLFIKKMAQKYFKNEITEIDSGKPNLPNESNIINETFNFIKLIKSKKLVITDRLHGMIFSIISSTPVIALGNSYHKVESSYFSWFYNISNTYFIKREELEIKLEKTILRIINSNINNNYNSNIFERYYSLMRKVIFSKIY